MALVHDSSDNKKATPETINSGYLNEVPSRDSLLDDDSIVPDSDNSAKHVYPTVAGYVGRWADEEDDEEDMRFPYTTDDSPVTLVESCSSLDNLKKKSRERSSGGVYGYRCSSRSPSSGAWRSDTSRHFHTKESTYKGNDNLITTIWDPKNAKVAQTKFIKEGEPGEKPHKSQEDTSFFCRSADVTPRHSKKNKNRAPLSPLTTTPTSSSPHLSQKMSKYSTEKTPSGNASLRGSGRYLALEHMLLKLSNTAPKREALSTRNVSIFGSGKPRDESRGAEKENTTASLHQSPGLSIEDNIQGQAKCVDESENSSPFELRLASKSTDSHIRFDRPEEKMFLNVQTQCQTNYGRNTHSPHSSCAAEAFGTSNETTSA